MYVCISARIHAENSISRYDNCRDVRGPDAPQSVVILALPVDFLSSRMVAPFNWQQAQWITSQESTSRQNHYALVYSIATATTARSSSPRWTPNGDVKPLAYRT